MAKKPRRPARKSAKKAIRKPAKPARKAAKKSTARKATRSSPARREASVDLHGWVTHTELASASPEATEAWCTKVLGWTFKPSMVTPEGEYRLFTYSNMGGGGIRQNNSPELPGSVPYVNVRDLRMSYEMALREGAEVMLPPTMVRPDLTVAIVRVPGGVPIGLAGP